MAAETPSGLTPYAELIDVLDALPVMLRETRRIRGLSIRDAGQQLGMAFSTISRIEAGADCVLSNAVAVLRWIGTPSVPGCGSAPPPRC